MALIVQKFGGSSVANAERVMHVAETITDTYKAGNDVFVVVSAQGDTTDDLIDKANEINPKASKREMDMLLTAGEQISIALLAMAIEKICSAGRRALKPTTPTVRRASKRCARSVCARSLTSARSSLLQASRDSMPRRI